MLELTGIATTPDPRIELPIGAPSQLVAKSLYDLILRLKRERPRWSFRIDAGYMYGSVYTGFWVVVDGEKIGHCKLDSAHRSGRTSWKFVISAHNLLKKAKGDDKRRTERIEAAATIITENFRPRTPDEIIAKSYGTLTMNARSLSYHRASAVKEVVDEKLDVLIDFAVDFAAAEKEERVFSVSEKFRKLIYQVIDAKEKAEEAEQACASSVGNAVYLWWRPSGWQVIYQQQGVVQSERRYPEFEDIPENIRGKAAVLSINEIERGHFEPGVGMKIGDKQFWVFQ